MDSRSRTLWLRTEPLHAVAYFDAQCRVMGKSLGLKGFWMGYFAARIAPMGQVDPGAATAALGVFAPGMVARALPAVWQIVTPGTMTDIRAHRAAEALRKVIPDIDARAGELCPPLAAMVEDAPLMARPLFAANRPLCDREDPVERLWQLSTAVREFRGDAHVAALADHGLDAPEALVLAAATDRVPRDGIRHERGWSEEEWAAAQERLRARGLVDAGGAATPRGHEERDLIEDATDRLAARLLRAVDDATVDTLLTALELPARQVLGAKVLPFPNPIGLPSPSAE
ncbi:SCO6745 family protein [Streptomyces sp. NPDC056231]|uniref:SCO6745 family protein n=1 Tax=Streptomyces sp. NPDC056231 TaxID=3345755 RepID=UPI003AAD5463